MRQHAKVSAILDFRQPIAAVLVDFVLSTRLRIVVDVVVVPFPVLSFSVSWAEPFIPERGESRLLVFAIPWGQRVVARAESCPCCGTARRVQP